MEVVSETSCVTSGDRNQIMISVDPPDCDEHSDMISMTEIAPETHIIKPIVEKSASSILPRDVTSTSSFPRDDKTTHSIPPEVVTTTSSILPSTSSNLAKVMVCADKQLIPSEEKNQTLVPGVIQQVPDPPKTAFKIFHNSMKIAMAKFAPGLTVNDRDKVLMEKWNRLSDNDKKIFYDKEVQDMERYKRQLGQLY